MRETESSPENNLFNDGMKKESEGKIKIAADQICTRRSMKVFWETLSELGCCRDIHLTKYEALWEL